MRLFESLCLTVFAFGFATPALADLVIDIPDVPEFTISDPIISDETIIINAGAGTNLIIDTLIEGPSLRIFVAGELSIDPDSEINVDVLEIVDQGGQSVIIGDGNVIGDRSDAVAANVLANLQFAEQAVTGLGATDIVTEFGRSARFAERLFSI